MLTFGRYEQLERIGIGGMAEVFRARVHGAEGFEKTLVLKRILPHLSEDPYFRAMFVDEAKISVALQHANIVQVFDLGRVNEQLFIVMEYVEGADLTKILKRASASGTSTLPPVCALFIASETLKGLHYAHNKISSDGRPLGVIHRDVSAGNILVSYTGEVKIGDFGIAKADQRNENTRAGFVKGKLNYLSPEQLEEGVVVDQRSDIYSMGLVLHTMLCGRHPVKGDSVPQIIDQIRSGKLAPPSAFVPSLPSELDQIVVKATAHDRQDRFQTAEEFQDALESFAALRKLKTNSRFLASYMRELFEQELAKAPETENLSLLGRIDSLISSEIGGSKGARASEEGRPGVVRESPLDEPTKRTDGPTKRTHTSGLRELPKREEATSSLPNVTWTLLGGAVVLSIVGWFWAWMIASK